MRPARERSLRCRGSPEEDVLKLGAVGAAGLLSSELLAACGGNDAAPRDVARPERARAPFESSAATGGATGLPSRVAWASTADSEFFLALGRGMQTGGHRARRRLRHGDVGQRPGAARRPDERLPRARASARWRCSRSAPTPTACAAACHRQGRLHARHHHRAEHDAGRGQPVPDRLRPGEGRRRLRHRGPRRERPGAVLQPRHRVAAAEDPPQRRARRARDGRRRHRGRRRPHRRRHQHHVGLQHDDERVADALGTSRSCSAATPSWSAPTRRWRSSGKLTDDMFLSGVDGDKEALELIKAGGAYKLSIAFAWTLMGYGLGQFGADWIEGSEVPQLIVARGVQLDSADAVEQFAAAARGSGRGVRRPGSLRGVPPAVRQRQLRLASSTGPRRSTHRRRAARRPPDPEGPRPGWHQRRCSARGGGCGIRNPARERGALPRERTWRRMRDSNPRGR